MKKKNKVLNSRVSNREYNVIAKMVKAYCHGNLSEFVRLACLSYDPEMVEKVKAYEVLLSGRKLSGLHRSGSDDSESGDISSSY